MIIQIKIGDITDAENRSDIIIAMNTELKEASAIGRPFVTELIPLQLNSMGSVLTFDYDGRRLLHMIICHRLGAGGWRNAEQYVRFALDHLWCNYKGRSYSIVQIGRGRIGQRDGANPTSILAGISTSFLPVVLYI